MKFSTSLITFGLLALVAATPVPKKSKTTTSSVSASATSAAASSSVVVAAAAATTGAGGSVLTSASYNTFQISGGTAGSAEAEANALFTGIDQNNLASVSAADLKIIQGIHDVAEDAETDAFNPAIDAASGDAATALQVRWSFFFPPFPVFRFEKVRMRANGEIERQDKEQGLEVDCGGFGDTGQGRTGR